MHSFRCSIAVLLLLGSAACAHEGMLAPELAPQPESAARTDAPAAGPRVLRICGPRQGPPSGVPLYVVDGVMMDALPEALDAMDVDRIEVIKGAAAVRMFGSRAEHGVILVTTLPPTKRSRT